VPWLAEVGRLPITTRITLERLGDEQIDSLVTHLAGQVPGQTAARIRERSQGIPFFVEVLTECANRDAARIPESLRDLMLTRFRPTARVGGSLGEHVGGSA